MNNLLENRTCPLEGGGSLISAERYDSLLSQHSRAELDALQLRRCHERFRIVAIGAPVPPFIGQPLDPPLRSRFAALRLEPLSNSARTKLAEHAMLSTSTTSSLAWRAVLTLESFCISQQQQQQQSQQSTTMSRLVRVPPIASCVISPFAARSISQFDAQSLEHLLRRVLPLDVLPLPDSALVWRAISEVIDTSPPLFSSSPSLLLFGYRIVARANGANDSSLLFTFRHIATNKLTRLPLIDGCIARHTTPPTATATIDELAPPPSQQQSMMRALPIHGELIAALVADLISGAW